MQQGQVSSSRYVGGPLMSDVTVRVRNVTTALYRRYRPESFADVIGQEHVTEPLMQALRTGRVNHAYLFSGPRGCGKTTSARILARCLNCEQGPTDIPCGVCDSCVALARGGSGSVDVIEIDAASPRWCRRRPRPARARVLRPGVVPVQDLHHRRGAHGDAAGLQRAAQDRRGAARAREVRVRHDRAREGHRHDPLADPPLPVPPGAAAAAAGLPRRAVRGRVGGGRARACCPSSSAPVAGSVRDSLSVLDQLIAGSGERGPDLRERGRAAGVHRRRAARRHRRRPGRRQTPPPSSSRSTRSSSPGTTRGASSRTSSSGCATSSSSRPSRTARRRCCAGVPEDQLERMRQQAAAFGPGALSRAADIVNAGLTEMSGATAPRLQLELICAGSCCPVPPVRAATPRASTASSGGWTSAGARRQPQAPPLRSPSRGQAPAPATARQATSPDAEAQGGPAAGRAAAAAGRPAGRAAAGPAAERAQPERSGREQRPGQARPARSAGQSARRSPVRATPGRAAAGASGRPAGTGATGGPAAGTGSRQPDGSEPGGGAVRCGAPAPRHARRHRHRRHPALVARRAGQDLLDQAGDVDVPVRARAGPGLRRPAAAAGHLDDRAGQHLPQGPARRAGASGAHRGARRRRRRRGHPHPGVRGRPRPGELRVGPHGTVAGTGAPARPGPVRGRPLVPGPRGSAGHGCGVPGPRRPRSRARRRLERPVGAAAGVGHRGIPCPAAPTRRTGPTPARTAAPGPVRPRPARRPSTTAPRHRTRPRCTRTAPLRTPRHRHRLRHSRQPEPEREPAPTRTASPMERARQAVAREAGARRAAAPVAADDSSVSADDEDIEDAGAMGVPVIERVLGGTVMGELDQ